MDSAMVENTRQLYHTTIKTQENCTDKPFLCILGMVCAAYHGYLVFYGASNWGVFKLFFTEPLQSKDLSVLSVLIHLFVITLLATMIITEIIVLLLFYIPETVIHLFYIGLLAALVCSVFIENIVHEAYASFIIFIVPSFITFLGLYIYIVFTGQIKKAVPKIKAVADIILRNQLATMVYIVISNCALLFTICSLTFILNIYYGKTRKGPDINAGDSVFTIISVFWSIGAMIFSNLCSDVYFSRILFSALRNMAGNREEAVVIPALTQVFQSLGTVFIGTLLSFFVFIIRAVNDTTYKGQKKKSSRFTNIIVYLTLRFLAFIVLYILRITIDMLNQFFMVYSSLYGKGYRSSMKGSFEATKSRKKKNAPIFVCAIIFFVAIFLLSALSLSLLYMLRYANVNFTLLYILLISSVASLALVQIYLNAIASCFLSFDLIEQLDPKLIYTVYPEVEPKK